jgi:predicted enzyme related to lactoylglutathione lyase
MKNTIDWFEIYTADFERAKKFYGIVFQSPLTDLPTDSERHSTMKYATFPDNGSGVNGGLVFIEEAKPGMGGTMVYFATEEIDPELSRVEAAGGKILRPKTHLGNFGFIALFQDTEGNMIGLHSKK